MDKEKVLVLVSGVWMKEKQINNKSVLELIQFKYFNGEKPIISVGTNTVESKRLSVKFINLDHYHEDQLRGFRFHEVSCIPVTLKIPPKIKKDLKPCMLDFS